MMRLHDEGKYPEAVKLAEVMLKKQEELLGRQHFNAKTAVWLAFPYQSMGNYAKAEPLFLEAKAIREIVLGKQHPDYASGLNNLALVYESMGDYARAGVTVESCVWVEG